MPGILEGLKMRNTAKYILKYFLNARIYSKAELPFLAAIGGVSGFLLPVALFKDVTGLAVISILALAWVITVRIRSQEIFNQERDDV